MAVIKKGVTKLPTGLYNILTAYTDSSGRHHFVAVNENMNDEDAVVYFDSSTFYMEGEIIRHSVAGPVYSIDSEEFFECLN